MFTIKIRGYYKDTEDFLDKSIRKLPSAIRSILYRYGQKGVEALEIYTPKDTGETATSWSYEVHDWGISWNNDKFTSDGIPLAILIQYGHGTRNGTYVQGMDYINPALKPIFEEISNDIWKEVQNL